MATRRTSSSLTSAMEEKLQHTKLDKSKESLSLSSILQALDGPMTEEDAWAILYQSAKTAFQCFNGANPPRTTSRHNNNNQQQSHQQQHANNNIHNLTDKSENEVMKCVVARETYQLWIHSDGHVHPHSFQAAADSIVAEKRTVAEREEQLLEGLGITIFDALDYGWETDTPERNLSPDLKQMVDFLVWADSGEAEDSAAAAAAASVFSTSTTSSSSASPAAAAAAYAMKTLSQVMDRCRMHFISKASSDQADALSKIICCKLVADTLRLPVKFSSAAAPPEAHPPPRPTPPAPPEAPTAAWVENMMQVIPQLRNGVKSKSASGGESARKPNEYEVTLLDDILSRRCKLHQVMVDGTPPRVKKDARTVALEHIRSRPPLRKESEWKQLKPRPPPEKIPFELLMESIRQHDSLEMKRKRCLLVIRTVFKKKLESELQKLRKEHKTAIALLKSNFDEEKQDLEGMIARGLMEKIELQRQKTDFEQRMSVRLQEFRDECERKKLEFEESVNLEIQKLIQEKNVLQGQRDEERRLKEEATNRLAHTERCIQDLEQQLDEARRTNGRRRSASVPDGPAILGLLPDVIAVPQAFQQTVQQPVRRAKNMPTAQPKRWRP